MTRATKDTDKEGRWVMRTKIVLRVFGSAAVNYGEKLRKE